MAPLADLLSYIASILVDAPEAIAVREEQDEGTLVLILAVGPGDVGKVIGKQGRTARAIRNLMHTAAALRDTRVHVRFVDT